MGRSGNDTFTKHVAKDRNIDPLQVEKVARGRVWTGEQAMALGLVDQMGGLQTALTLAKQEGGLTPEAPVEVYPRSLTLFEMIFSLLEEKEEDFISQGNVFNSLLDSFKQLKMVLTILFSSQGIIYTPFGKIK